MTDLEADVDDPPDAWADGDEDDEDDEDDADERVAEEPPPPPYGQTTEDPLDRELASSSRNLSLMNGSEPSSPSSSYAPSASTGPSLIARRLAARPQIEPISEPDDESMDTTDGSSARPIGDAWHSEASVHSNGHSTPRGADVRSLSPAANDALVREGPLTPLNDAGPFVFDGSAGRASARSEGADT